MIDPQEEIALIDAAKSDPNAFGLLYERYVDRIYNYIYFRIDSKRDAEDLTGQVFFKAMSNIKSYRHMGLPFSAWLYRIAHNLVANYYHDRVRKREIALDDEQAQFLPQYDQHPEKQTVKTQEIENLMAAIRKLSPIRQELLVLKFLDQLSNAEIGKILRKSEGAIKSLYHRTLLELRDIMSTGKEENA